MDALQTILDDRTHGSTFLIEAFLKLVIKGDIDQINLPMVSNKMIKRFNDMQIIKSALERLEKASNLKNEALDIKNRLTKGSEIIAEKLRTLLPENPILLTHSHSHAVIEVLKLIKFKQVFCMESLPGGEGDEMAKIIGGKIVMDTMLTTFFDDHKIDAVLFGCDQFDNTTIVNKVGSKHLTDLARLHHIPVYTITSSLKEVPLVSKSLEDEWLEAFERNLVSKIITD